MILAKLGASVLVNMLAGNDVLDMDMETFQLEMDF